jgi:hypothetical protein
VVAVLVLMVAFMVFLLIFQVNFLKNSLAVRIVLAFVQFLLPVACQHTKTSFFQGDSRTDPQPTPFHPASLAG